MATLTVSHDALHVRLTPAEKVLGLLRDQTFPLSSVASARVVDHGLDAVRGLRAPGLGLPGLRMIGTWRGSRRSLVSVRRGQPAVVVELVGERYGSLVIGSDDAAAVVDELEARTARR